MQNSLRYMLLLIKQYEKISPTHKENRWLYLKAQTEVITLCCISDTFLKLKVFIIINIINVNLLNYAIILNVLLFYNVLCLCDVLLF